MFTLTAAHGQLEVDGTGIQTPMSKWLNLQVLLRDEDTIEGDTYVSGGKVLNPVRGDGIRETLEGFMSGDVDHAGSSHSSRTDGFVTNLVWFRTNISTRTGTGDGTRSLELAIGGQTLTATGRVGPIRVAPKPDGNGLLRVTLDIWIPKGAFT